MLLIQMFFSIFFLQVIGRGGEQISRIQQESGCKIQIAPGNYLFAFFFVWLPSSIPSFKVHFNHGFHG